jgi:Zn finger protein HypA/HybF involved in hydrogenase expression
MHEVGLMRDALDRAIDLANVSGARRIESLEFVVAVGGQVPADLVTELFAALSVNTLAEGAIVTVRERDAERRCDRCGQRTPAAADVFECGDCGAILPPWDDLPDLYLESISIVEHDEVPECA